ncbi:MAG: GntR family transcriptional regulator [Alicyclobacillus sp.]|nr:GntR family transcriptional regulator [Alicyclobacillus sp.]
MEIKGSRSKGDHSQPGFALDYTSPIPLHHQLSEMIRRGILDGTLTNQAGRIPTEQQLARRFGVSRITVRTALHHLENQGLIWRRRGVGTFVRTNYVENWVGRLLGFSETIRAAGFEPKGKVLRSGKARWLPYTVAKNLGVTSAWVFKRLRFADNEPIAIEESYFTQEIGDALEQQTDLANLLTYQFIERELQIRLSEARQVINAVNAQKTEARLLGLPEGAALLSIERVTKSSDGRPIEFLRAKYRPDYFHYVIDLHRQS